MSAKMPNISQGILCHFLPIHPLEQRRSSHDEVTLTRFPTLKEDHSNRPNMSQGQFDSFPTFTQEVRVTIKDAVTRSWSNVKGHTAASGT